MNDADVSKQIPHMVLFIRQEAEEKANEISVSAEELVEAEKKKIRQEYERKEKQVEIRKRRCLIREEGIWTMTPRGLEYVKGMINLLKDFFFATEYSMQLNASGIKDLQAQDDVVSSMKEAAEKDLLTVSRDHHAHVNLLTSLIVQVIES